MTVIPVRSYLPLSRVFEDIEKQNPGNSGYHLEVALTDGSRYSGAVIFHDQSLLILEEPHTDDGTTVTRLYIDPGSVIMACAIWD